MEVDLILTKPKPKKKIDINKAFAEKQEEFLESLNAQEADLLASLNFTVDEIDTLTTRYGEALKLTLTDQNNSQWSFLCSGKVFRELFENNVKVKDKIVIFKNEKNHWRFNFVE